MGKTRSLLEKLQEEYNYYELARSYTIDKFVQEVKYGNDKKFKEWLDNKMIIIIDECTVVDIFLLKKLLKYVKNNGIMLLFVGDNDQFWSIGPGSPLDIDDSLNEIQNVLQH
jgi:ATP-dependent exoDNAse (exonuclease V) alpha subunit